MKDIMSALVVIVFIVIVFRKRLAPLFRVFKKKQVLGTTVEAAVKDETGQMLRGLVFSRYEFLAFDVDESGGDLTRFCEDVALKLSRKSEYLNMNGTIIGVTAIPLTSILLFMIEWQPLSGERN